MDKKTLSQSYLKQFGTYPEIVVKSPGRINFLGEHVDYNNGYVLPAAIDKEIWLAMGRSGDDQGLCSLHALDLAQEHSFYLHNFANSPLKWPDYVLGVVRELQVLEKNPQPFNCVFGGTIPSGAGLSSSAALECGIAFGLGYLFDLKLSRQDVAVLSKKAENNFVGVNCGIMDQFASVFGRAANIIKLDCDTLQFNYIPFDWEDVKVVLCDSGVKHSLGDSEYNKRRKECETFMEITRKKFPQVASFRDIDSALLDDLKNDMNPILFNRGKYVVEEIGRVKKAEEYLQAKQLASFGLLMNETHEGLSKYYEVSCKELDSLQSAAVGSGLVYGSRMMGGGFGGCTINLVDKHNVQSFVDVMSEVYAKEFQADLKVYTTTVSSGTSIVE